MSANMWAYTTSHNNVNEHGMYCLNCSNIVSVAKDLLVSLAEELLNSKLHTHNV